MNKLFTTLILILIFLCSNLFAASKNPLKIFKKDILGGDAKKFYKAEDSLNNEEEILSYSNADKAIGITLDYEMEGHPEDWNVSDSQAQRWEFKNKKNKYYKIGKEFYVKYIFKIDPGENHAANIFQTVGTKKDGEIIFPSMQIMYTTDENEPPNRFQFLHHFIDEVFWTKKDPTANRFKKTTYKFQLGGKSTFKKFRTILMKIKVSDKDDGEFIMWLDNDRIIETYGPNIILGQGMALKIGLYRYWERLSNFDPNSITSSTLFIKDYTISKKCNEVMDDKKCNYKSKERVSATSLKYRVSSTYNKPKGATVIKSIKAKKIHKEIKYQDLKGNFLAIIKNKKDEKYLLKNTGFTKEAAANDGIEECKENFPNVLDLDNNGCYIHYQKKVTQF